MSTVRPSKTPDAALFGGPPSTASAAAQVPAGGQSPAAAESSVTSIGGQSEPESTSTAEPSDLLGDKTVISARPVGQSSSAGTKTTAVPIGLQGTRLAHFELLEFVGGGGMGAVYRGHDLKLDRPVAIKVLAREQASDGDLVRRFQNEARSAARLDHDNIARVYDFGEDSGWHYIVFEFVEGQNVRDLVQQSGPLAVADAMHYTQQLAMALHHAAERDVVHRDIKPSNVVLNQSDHVKLVDMGLARLHQIDAPGDDLTASGVTLGTFDYISPEQARDPRAADVRSDIYSLGCTLFFMLTGSPPFPHGTALQKLLSHTNDPAPDPRQFRNDIPAEVVGVMQRMMAKDPDQRYQDPREIIVDIGQMSQRFGWEERHHFPTLIVHSHQRAVGFWERQLTWMGPVAMVAAIAVGAEMFARYQQPAPLAVPQFVVQGSAESGSPPTASGPGAWRGGPIGWSRGDELGGFRGTDDAARISTASRRSDRYGSIVEQSDGIGRRYFPCDRFPNRGRSTGHSEVATGRRPAGCGRRHGERDRSWQRAGHPVDRRCRRGFTVVGFGRVRRARNGKLGRGDDCRRSELRPAAGDNGPSFAGRQHA